MMAGGMWWSSHFHHHLQTPPFPLLFFPFFSPPPLSHLLPIPQFTLPTTSSTTTTTTSPLSLLFSSSSSSSSSSSLSNSHMDGRQSFPKRPFPPAKEKPKNADGEGDHDLPGGDSAVGGAAGEGEEEKRARTFSPPKGGSGGNYASYPPGGGGGGRRAGGSGPQPPFCLVERCTANLAEAKRYYRRHKVCEAHSKAPVVIVAGLRQRFCQQCSRFHELSEFDEVKRSCRRRLVGHNERRRKSSSESQGEGSNHFRPAE